MANDQPRAATRRPRAPSAPPAHGRPRASPDAGHQGYGLPTSIATGAKSPRGDCTTSSPSSVISIGGDPLAGPSAPPAHLRHQDAESLPLARNPSRSPRRHASHRISHLIDSLRHLHIPHPHLGHDHHHTQSTAEPNDARSRLLASDPDASSGFNGRIGASGGAPAAVPVSQNIKAEKFENRASFRKSWDPSVSSKMRDSRSPVRRRLSMRMPATFSTSPPSGSLPAAAAAPHNQVATIEERDNQRSSSNPPGPASSPSGARHRMSRSGQRGERASDHSSARPSDEKTRSSSQSNSHHEQGERERRDIDQKCRTLGLDVTEMGADGHCLYAAVADQLNILTILRGSELSDDTKLTYKDTRKAAAATMRSDPDTYMPFISDSDEKMAGITNDVAGTTAGGDQSKFFLSYCDAVERTAVWGGQPEILALSRAYRTPIFVVQAGSSPLKFGEEFAPTTQAYLAYYRAAYGLGEHFNSLRPYKYRAHAN